MKHVQTQYKISVPVKNKPPQIVSLTANPHFTDKVYKYRLTKLQQDIFSVINARTGEVDVGFLNATDKRDLLAQLNRNGYTVKFSSLPLVMPQDMTDYKPRNQIKKNREMISIL